MKWTILFFFVACTATATIDSGTVPGADTGTDAARSLAGSDIACTLSNTVKTTQPNGAWSSVTKHFAWIDGVAVGDSFVVEKCNQQFTSIPPTPPCTMCPVETGDPIPLSSACDRSLGAGTFYVDRLLIVCGTEQTSSNGTGFAMTSTVRFYR